MSATASVLPFVPRDFILYRRDSPNLVEMAHRAPTPWMTDFFLLASSTTRDALPGQQHNSRGGSMSASGASNHRESPFLGSLSALSPDDPAAVQMLNAAAAASAATASDPCTRPITIIVHICPVTGRFLHRNLRGVDVFDTRAEAMNALERNLGCVRVPDGQFGALLGACFVRNPAESVSGGSGPIPLTELHIVVCDSPFQPDSVVPPAAAMATMTMMMMPPSVHQQQQQQQGAAANTATLFGVLRSPPIAPIPSGANSSAAAHLMQHAASNLAVTPGFRAATSVRTICVSSPQLGVLCDPQIDYSAPATVQASSAAKTGAALPSSGEVASLIAHYGQHLAFLGDMTDMASPSSSPSSAAAVSTSFTPRHYTAGDFASMDRDQLRWSYEEAPRRVTEIRKPGAPPPPKLQGAEITNTLETAPAVVPWNFGLASALHHRASASASSDLSWLCAKVTPVFEQTVVGIGSAVSVAASSSSSPPSSSSSFALQQQQQQQPFESLRVACVPTFVLLRASRAQLEPLDNATIRWNLFCAGTECAVLSIRQQQQPLLPVETAPAVRLEKWLWVCSCPRSQRQQQQQQQRSSSSASAPAAAPAAQNQNPSASPEMATEHFTVTQMREFFAAVETAAVAQMRRRWEPYVRAAAASPPSVARHKILRDASESLFASHVAQLDFGFGGGAAENDDDDDEAATSSRDEEIKTLLTSTTKSAWLEFVVSSLSTLEPKQQQQQQQQTSQRGRSPDSALLLRIAEHCYHASRVACLQCTVVGLPRVCPLPAPRVVRLRINRAPIAASLAANRTLVADMLPGGVLRGIWCHNRVLRNTVAVTFAVPRGTRIAAVGFLRPLLVRPAMHDGKGGTGSGGGGSSSSHSGVTTAVVASNGGFVLGADVPTRQLPGCPFPASNRPELKYKAPFPSSAWSVSLCVSDTPHAEEHATLLLHDVSLPIVMYTEQQQLQRHAAGAASGKHHSAGSAPEHALCVIRVPPATVAESASLCLTRGFFDTDDRPSAPANNAAATPTTAQQQQQQVQQTGRCSFVTVILRGSLNSEAAFGAHQIVLFGEGPDVLRADALSTGVTVVDPAPAAPASPSSQPPQSLHALLASCAEPRTLHEAIIAEERRHDARLTQTEWHTALCCTGTGGSSGAVAPSSTAAAAFSPLLRTSSNAVRPSRLDINAHAVELPLSADMGRAIAAAGGAAGADPAPTTVSATCQIIGCGKGGFFTRLATCDSCGKQVCGNHWRKIKDWRILVRCSAVGIYQVCAACEQAGSLLDGAMKSLAAKRVAVLSAAGAPAAAAAAVDVPASALVPLAAVADAASTWQPSQLCVRDDEDEGESDSHGSSGGCAVPPRRLSAADDGTFLPPSQSMDAAALVAGFRSTQAGTGGWRAPARVAIVGASRVAVSFCVPRQAHGAAERLFLLLPASSGGGQIVVGVASVRVASGDGAETVAVVPHGPQQRSAHNNNARSVRHGDDAADASGRLHGDGDDDVGGDSAGATATAAALTQYEIPLHAVSASSGWGGAVLSTSSMSSSLGASAADVPSGEALPLEWSPVLPSSGRQRGGLLAAVGLARGHRRHAPFGAQQLASPICAVDVVTVTLDVVSALLPHQGGAAQMLRATGGLLICFAAHRSSLAAITQEMRLATFVPPRRRAVSSIFAQEEDDDGGASSTAGSPRIMSDSFTFHASNSNMSPDPASTSRTGQLSAAELARRRSSMSSNYFHPNNNHHHQQQQPQQHYQQHHHVAHREGSSTSSSAGIRTHDSSLPSTTAGILHAAVVVAAPPIQYSTECTADMSVRNMLLCPPGPRTHCRTWIRPPPPALPSSPTSPQQHQQQQQPASPTHGVWGHAAGIMLRLPFAVAPSLGRGAPAVNAATCVRSFRAFVVERSLYCRAAHVATMHVPLVFLVTRSTALQNGVEVFVPFGQSVKEQNAAGFVLDVATTERGYSSAGWEREWAALADAASPFFVRDPLSQQQQQQQQQQQHSGDSGKSRKGADSARLPLSPPMLAPGTGSLGGYRGSPLATVNMGEATGL